MALGEGWCPMPLKGSGNMVKAMKKRKMSSEDGFTIIELITVIGILSVLAGISIQTFAVYREDAFYSNSETGLRNAKVALEAGLANEENLPENSILTTATFAAGRVTQGSATLIAPGLNNNPNSYIYVYHNTGCNSEWCLTDWITARHCKSDQYVYYYRYANGFQRTIGNVDVGGWRC
jgi:prepilin-type N-terminal cleavage/methylation domain-containing protein